MNSQPDTNFCYTGVQVSEEVYLKDPTRSDLGKAILSKSVDLIDKDGFAKFSMRKLSESIGSPESSLYRYFKNKHNLLIYLTAWYWDVVQCKIAIRTANIPELKEVLFQTFSVLTEEPQQEDHHTYLDEAALRRIVISESIQSYYAFGYSKLEAGSVVSAKRIVDNIADLLSEKHPYYPYPKALVYTVVEAAHEQLYFLTYHPELTELKSGAQIAEFAVSTIIGGVKASAPEALKSRS